MNINLDIHGYPWQNATASLKHGDVHARSIAEGCYPWQNATASLKLDGGHVVGIECLVLSVAKRHGLIEARKRLTRRRSRRMLSVAKRHGLIEAGLLR